MTHFWSISSVVMADFRVRASTRFSRLIVNRAAYLPNSLFQLDDLRNLMHKERFSCVFSTGTKLEQTLKATIGI
jgi:hypothetical protein